MFRIDQLRDTVRARPPAEIIDFNQIPILAKGHHHTDQILSQLQARGLLPDTGLNLVRVTADMDQEIRHLPDRVIFRLDRHLIDHKVALTEEHLQLTNLYKGGLPKVSQAKVDLAKIDQPRVDQPKVDQPRAQTQGKFIHYFT